MSDLFRNLSGQNASSSRNNTQWWVDAAAQSKDLQAKKDRGETLTPDEQAKLALGSDPKQTAYWAAKAKTQGVEPSTTVSASTGVPDLTDQTAQAAKMNQALMLVSGRGRRASMSNGEFGDSMLGGF